MDQHGLGGWEFKFNNTRSTIASCDVRNQVIKMSSYYPALADYGEVKLVLLHEVAHALLPFEHGHDAVWKKKCIEIGGDGKRLADHADRFSAGVSLYAIQCSQGEILGYVNSSTYNPKGRACIEHGTSIRLVSNPNLVIV